VKGGRQSASGNVTPTICERRAWTASSKRRKPGLKMRLAIRDLDTGQERDRVDANHHLEHPDWSPDGQWIIYNPTCGDACEQVEQVPANNLDAEPDVLCPADDTHFGYKPVCAPDGTQIVFGAVAEPAAAGLSEAEIMPRLES
jgi:WD40-like Beta Propeller Repeat